MEEKIKDAKTTVNPFAELQQMIEKELGGIQMTETQGSFQPLTEGLGLQAPLTKKEIETPTPIVTEKREEASEPEPVPTTSKLASLNEKKEPPKGLQSLLSKVTPPVEAAAPKKSKLASKLAQLESKVTPAPKATPTLTKSLDVKPTTTPELEAHSANRVVPPPVPRPSIFKRALAALIDECFVVTLWLVAMVITLRLLTGSFVGLTASSLTVVEDPQFIRFAILEFITLWLAYFAVCIGMLDMTFGMWIWGIRVGYGSDIKAASGGKRAVRALLSFVFYAPIVPLVFLMIARRGRNLLDVLSGSLVYQAGLKARA